MEKLKPLPENEKIKLIMVIKSKLSEREFIQANFVILYSKTSMKIYTGILVLFFVLSVLTINVLPGTSISQVFVPVGMLSIMPLFTYIGAKRNFNTNQRLSELIEYRFDDENFSMIGESFHATFTWAKIHQVTHTKNWILIWQNRQIANPVSKKDLWAGDVNELKDILNKHNVKNNL